MSLKKVQQYRQKYRKVWEAEFPWLGPVSGDESHGFCKACKVQILAKKKDLMEHGKTKKHGNQMKVTVTTVQIDTFLKGNLTAKKEFQTKELKLACFVAEHTSMKSIDHLGELLKTLDPEHFNVKLHRTKCTAIITEVLAPVLKRELIDDIGNSAFSLILDESNDISRIKCLGAVIRYFSYNRNRIVDSMYCLVELGDCGATGITDLLLQTLKDDGLNIKRLCGIGVDGANAMVGEHHSVFKLLKDNAGEHLILSRCVCHSLHLAASHASEVLPRNLDFMIKETASWFSYSHKRRLEYDELYKTFNNVSPSKISNASTTRWLARREIVGKILKQYVELKTMFMLKKDNERCYTSALLYNMYSDITNKIYLVYLHSILDEVVRVNVIFQTKNPNVLIMFDDLMSLYMSLLAKAVVPAHLKNINKSNALDFEFKNFLMHTSGMYFGYESETLLANIPNSMEIKERCKEFLVELIDQVKKRLPNNIKLLLMLTSFSPLEAMKVGRCEENIVPFIHCFTEFLRKIDPNFSADGCIDEYKALYCEKSLEELGKDPKNVVDFWAAVYRIENACGYKKYGNIANLVLTLLTCPLSNASVERLFSEMNTVKSKLRNRLLVKTTEKVLIVRHCLKNIRGETCVTFKVNEKMFNLFNSKNLYESTVEELSELDNIFNDF